MRKVLVAMAVLALSGCASLIGDAYDDHARSECAQSRDQGGCNDRVDQNRRARERGN